MRPSFAIFTPAAYLLVICREMFRLVLLSVPFVHAVTLCSFVSPLLARHRNTIEVPPILRPVSPYWHGRNIRSVG